MLYSVREILFGVLLLVLNKSSESLASSSS